MVYDDYVNKNYLSIYIFIILFQNL